MDNTEEDKDLFLKSLDASNEFKRAGEKYMKIKCEMLFEDADEETSNKRSQKLRKSAIGLNAAYSQNFFHVERVVGEPRYFVNFVSKQFGYGFITGVVIFCIFPNRLSIARFLDDFIAGVF
jgi:hypothetical protein